MKPTQHHGIKLVTFAVCLFTALCIILQSEINNLPVAGALIGLDEASASAQYGILGHLAPELKLNTWIGGDGEDIEPIRLKDYRGKVVYLYFFQDW